MANIISLKDITSIPELRILMYIRKERAIIVYCKNKQYKFIEYKYGFNYFNNTNINTNNTYVTDYCLLNTVK